MKTSILGLALVVALPAMPASANHTITNQGLQQNASGTCNGALPVFDQALRFRPLAVANEGTGNAFVSCTQINGFGNEVTVAGLALQNTGAAAATISCSLVNGRDSYYKSTYPKSITLAAGATGVLSWTSDDNLGNNFADMVSFSCNLPAGTELEYTQLQTVTGSI